MKLKKSKYLGFLSTLGLAIGLSASPALSHMDRNADFESSKVEEADRFESGYLAVAGRINKNFAPLALNHGHRFPTYHFNLHKVQEYFTLNGTVLMCPWNKDYKKIQKIFVDDTQGKLNRANVRNLHRLLYGKGVFKSHELLVKDGDQFLQAFDFGVRENESRRYTYVILPDGSFNFSETGDSKAVDLISKHAVHSKAAKSVIYAGELSVRKVDGRYVLVIDNGSGTYTPGNANGELTRLKNLLEFNFPGLHVISKLYNESL